MLEKIEVGKEYIRTAGDKVTVLHIGETHAFVKFDNREESISISHCLRYWSKITTPKKRYWLWDVKSRYGEIFKSTTYIDEKGENTNGSSCLYGDSLLKKHENEWIEV